MYISVLQIKQQQATTMDFNVEFITRLIPKLDWPTVCASAAQVMKQILIYALQHSELDLLHSLSVGNRQRIASSYS